MFGNFVDCSKHYPQNAPECADFTQIFKHFHSGNAPRNPITCLLSFEWSLHGFAPPGSMDWESWKMF